MYKILRAHAHSQLFGNTCDVLAIYENSSISMKKNVQKLKKYIF